MAKSLEGVIVKKAHQLENYTEQQILEFARCADPVTGPQYFMNPHDQVHGPGLQIQVDFGSHGLHDIDDRLDAGALRHGVIVEKIGRAHV